MWTNLFLHFYHHAFSHFPCTWVLFYQMSIVIYYLVWLLTNHMLLTCAACVGSALTSVCKTWPSGHGKRQQVFLGVTLFAKDSNYLMSRSVLHTRWERQAIQTKKTYLWGLKQLLQKLDFLKRALSLNGKHLVWFLSLTSLHSWPRHLASWGNFSTMKCSRTTFLDLLDPGCDSKCTNSWNRLVVSGFCWLTLVGFHISQFHCMCMSVHTHLVSSHSRIYFSTVSDAMVW
jgi:hypothetical protein